MGATVRPPDARTEPTSGRGYILRMLRPPSALGWVKRSTLGELGGCALPLCVLVVVVLRARLDCVAWLLWISGVYLSWFARYAGCSARS